MTRFKFKVNLIAFIFIRWNDRLHGNVSESFWIWVEDSENNTMYHQEYFIITKREVSHFTVTFLKLHNPNLPFIITA